MCGIVGAVSARNIVPDPRRGPEAARIPRLRLLRRGRAPGRRTAARAQHLARGRAGSPGRQPSASKPAPASPTRAGPRTARRRCTTRTRTSRPGRRRGRRAGQDRAGAQRHHREPRRTARRAAGARAIVFDSQTDTEVIAHLVTHLYDGDLFDAVQRAVPQLHGAYAIAVFCRDEPHRVVGAREGSPLVLGVGEGETFLASRRDGAGRRDRPDRLPRRGRRGRPAAGQALDRRPRRAWHDGRFAPVQREVRTVHAHSGAAELGPYRHYMQKEIFEQPRAIADTLDARGRHQPRAVRRRRLQRLQGGRPGADPGLRHQLLRRLGAPSTGSRPSPASRPASRSPANTATAPACPTRARWSSRSAQSGETADTLAALKHARSLGMTHTLTDLQRGHQRDGARMQARLHHARRRRDRRGLDQGLHHPAGRPVPADAGAGAGARPPERRAGSRST